MKYHYNDITNLTKYYLDEYAKKNNLNYQFLEDLYLELLERDFDHIYKDMYNEAFEEGRRDALTDNIDSYEYVSRKDYDDMETELRRKINQLEKENNQEIQENYRLGFIDGYKNGVEWLPPQKFKEDLDNI